MNYCKIEPKIDINLQFNTIASIQQEYLKDNIPWSLGFSGGKDSTALLKLVYLALEKLNKKSKPITIIYCDTGVEIPIVRLLVKQTLNDITLEALEHDLPIKAHIVFPPLKDRYFSKVIGRGYPPPSYKFRWCTDVLRINPIKRFLNNIPGQSNVLLGIRRNESVERNRTLLQHKTNNEHYFRQSGNKNVIIYSPIIEYSEPDIWSVINEDSSPQSIDARKLQDLYSILVLDKSKTITSTEIFHAKGRFGCWTCTVVRQDKAVKNMIDGGYESLEPLLEFRNWLAEIRDDDAYRYKRRRNGDTGLGPFTLEARKIILDKLLEAQNKSEWNLIESEEVDYITYQWRTDS